MKISCSLSSKSDKATGCSEILLRMVVGKINGKSVAIRAKSGIWVPSDRWDSKREKINKDVRKRVCDDETNALISRLDEAERNLNELIVRITEEFRTADPREIDSQWLSKVIFLFHHPEKNPDAKGFFQLFDRFLDVRNLSDIRIRNYRVVYRTLQRFELYRHKALDIDTMTSDDLRDFDHFLRIEHTLADQSIFEAIPECRKPVPRGQNTITCEFNKIRAFFNWCRSEGYTKNYPFDKFEIAPELYGTPIYITKKERDAIFNADLSSDPQLAVQRDIFIFHSCIGCRVSDLMRMTKSNIVGNSIEYVAGKTKDSSLKVLHVPLMSISKEILDRYPEGPKLLPFISAQRYNHAIKKIFKAAGVTRMVTVIDPLTREEKQVPINEIASSHMARKTFCGNLYRSVKDPDLVGSLSGHAHGSAAFTRYRDIDDDMKQELVRELE